ncbi:right-handed parallel beta-helix repeat-containing protein [Fictibacillus fluitans]|uniref:Right-handed parallel beta-helix repeat-containing protein n=1 Tax=Fictibacillus fluitans TaxID=3058422 RepID=A0ABT8I159_9BACL|nr:right-handed parallel beta-helix repeat-containing protein [Fictibacillus sp. NE201]MDN4526714.1 right-handed parallel beta-helix repeat-containing protein [Fictibacillus sp. NE201]
MSSYVLELQRWNVKNDGTDAPNTSKGINAALVWAAQQNYTEVVLPKGTYLIDETNPIQPQSYQTLNLGSATLRIRDNGLPGYSIVSFRSKQQYSRVTNGKIEGDRYSHNYSSGGTHEFGVGVELKYGVKNITVDQLEIYNTTGDGVIAITSYGGISSAMDAIARNLELGGINTRTGIPETNPKRIRTRDKIPMVPQITNVGFFGLFGDSYGGIGREITTDTYDMIFYKSDDSFLSSATDLHFFDTVEIPQGASYAKATLHQATLPSTTGNTLTIRTPEFPTHCYIEKCNLHHCRRLGVAICGVKHFYVRNCEIHHISGTAPAGAIDIEDGYDINQFIYIEENNIFDNSAYNIIAVAGRHITITKNRIHLGIFTINPGVNLAFVTDNYFVNAGPRLSGECQFSNNQLSNCRLLLLDQKEALIDNCFFHNSPINFSKTKAYVAQVNNCKFLYDDDFYNISSNSGAPLIFSIEPQSITDCVFEGSGIEAFTVVPVNAFGWLLDSVTFLNIKHRQGRMTGLPPGSYTGCQFINTGSLTYGTNLNAEFNFTSCIFKWDSYDLFYLGSKIAKLSFKDCSFFGGKQRTAFFFWDIGGKIELINNSFSFPASETNTAIIDFWSSTFTAESVLISGNKFASNRPMIAVNASTLLDTIRLIFRDNILSTVIVRLASNHIKLNNIYNGVLGN